MYVFVTGFLSILATSTVFHVISLTPYNYEESTAGKIFKITFLVPLVNE